jgi:hypothetical protein
MGMSILIFASDVVSLRFLDRNDDVKGDDSSSNSCAAPEMRSPSYHPETHKYNVSDFRYT